MIYLTSSKSDGLLIQTPLCSQFCGYLTCSSHVPHMFCRFCLREQMSEAVSLDIFWILSCSLLVKCVQHVRVSPCEETAGQCVEASQWASGRVDEVSNTWRTWNWTNTKISGWRRGAEHDEDEDVHSETRGGSRSSGDEGRRRVDELWTTTLICPQQSLYVMSRLLLLYRLRLLLLYRLLLYRHMFRNKLLLRKH